MNIDSKKIDLSVLVVEDENDVMNIMVRHLKRFIKDVDFASNGQDALEKFKNKVYDLIVSDIKMPNMTGLEMLDKIKHLGYDPFVILVTAFNETHYLTDAIKLRVNGFLNKPVLLDELDALIYGYYSIIQLKKESQDKNFLLEQYRCIMDKTSSLLEVDEAGNVLFANQNFSKRFNFSSNDLFSATIDNFDEIKSFIKDNGSYSDTVKLVVFGNQRNEFYVYATQTIGSSGCVLNYLFVVE